MIILLSFPCFYHLKMKKNSLRALEVWTQSLFCHPEPLSDELLSWLCNELTEDDAALLVMSLRRSTVQIARLRAPHSFSHSDSVETGSSFLNSEIPHAGPLFDPCGKV